MTALGTIPANGDVAQQGLPVSVLPVLDVGMAGQLRAGRVLTVADFTALGLSAPVGLYNLSSVNDSSGTAYNLTNKGAVPFAPGITGAAGEAAQFAGSTAQALYRTDIGASDPFRIAAGSMGCWFRTAKRGSAQALITKWGAGSTGDMFNLFISSTNALTFANQVLVSSSWVNGGTDVCDDRWHFAVVVNDAVSTRLYLDGVLEASGLGAVFPTPTTAGAPFNIGSQGADAATAGGAVNFGRIDEAFITGDVLSDDQVRMLYAAKLPHGLAAAPRGIDVAVRRRRKGPLLATADFPASPVRLHNLALSTGSSVSDLGSGAVGLTAASGGVRNAVAGPDGAASGAVHYSGAHGGDSATDAGLPSGLAARSYGLWFRAVPGSAAQTFAGWGTLNTDARIGIYGTNSAASVGQIFCVSGGDLINAPFAADGAWHFAVVVEDNAAADGVKRKVYVDGKMVGGSGTLTSLTLAGAGRYRIGANPDGTQPLTGQAARAFVSAVALTSEQIESLYAKGSPALPASPKNSGDHIEGVDATNLYVVHDTLEPQHQIDLTVTA